MLVEIAKPVLLTFCMIALYAVFHTAFLAPASDFGQRLYDSSALLVLAAGISFISGLIFRDAPQRTAGTSSRVVGTLPVQIFCWASGIMLILFLLSWYLETHCVFYRDVRWW
jgi:hypothetical protein